MSRDRSPRKSARRARLISRAARTAPPLVLALDAGTSSTRCLGFDLHGRLVRDVAASRPCVPRYTPDGGAELDAERWLAGALACLREGATRAAERGSPVLGVAACTFWHAVLGVDEGGRALTPILLWNDMRAGPAARELRHKLDGADVHRRTGCVLHPSYLPARLLWLRLRDPALFARCARFVSPGEWLELRLFGAARVSVSMASGTGLLDQDRMAWDVPLLEALELEPRRLSPLMGGHSPLRGMSRSARGSGRLKDVPFFPALGDGACNSLGSGATVPDRAALMVGTSAALRLMVPAGTARGESAVPRGLWRYRLDAQRALIGGAISNGGNVHAWLSAALRLESPARLEGRLKRARPGAHGLAVLPFLAGERNPDFPLDATGRIAGLRMSTTSFDIFHAALEAVAFRLASIAGRLEAAAAARGTPLAGYLASGGLLRSPAWVQMLADVLGRPVTAAPVLEASARGAALMALEALGMEAGGKPARERAVYRPDPARQELYRASRERHEKLYTQWWQELEE